MSKFLNSRPYLIFEFLILCLAVPGYIIITKSAPFLFAFLWGATLYGYLVLRNTSGESLKALWKWSAVNWESMKPMLVRWFLASIAMIIFIYFYDPERFLFLPRERPQVMLGLVTFYPAFSALPQEFIFCTFFFARYAPFFGNGRGMILASAVIFAYAHVLYINPIAPTMSFLGGLIFAQTYWKSRSLALVTLEHSLYGISLFFSGLGWYFYSGAVQ
ncbi:MAG: CPBP family glutamic-type intramembrane protease [Pseudomonadota bacterium]